MGFIFLPASFEMSNRFACSSIYIFTFCLPHQRDQSMKSVWYTDLIVWKKMFNWFTSSWKNHFFFGSNTTITWTWIFTLRIHQLMSPYFQYSHGSHRAKLWFRHADNVFASQKLNNKSEKWGKEIAKPVSID